ncbi:hypothetical protein [Corallococcus exercitus]|uniref:hypothetical protein n=1 Tax=Corallococcus exercitus TaxID=2316736 RepID=UPI0035D505A4
MLDRLLNASAQDLMTPRALGTPRALWSGGLQVSRKKTYAAYRHDMKHPLRERVERFSEVESRRIRRIGTSPPQKFSSVMDELLIKTRARRDRAP